MSFSGQREEEIIPRLLKYIGERDKVAFCEECGRQLHHNKSAWCCPEHGTLPIWKDNKLICAFGYKIPKVKK